MSSTITREQFASAVASAISSVHHLYREVDRLMSGLRDGLAEEPDPLAPFIGFAKAGRNQTRSVIRNEYGALFWPTVNDEENGDEDEEEIDDEGDDTEEDDVVAKSRKHPKEIAANEPLFAVRIVMYDPRKQDSFEPEIRYSAMSNWTVGKGNYIPEQRFVVPGNMLRRIPKVLVSSLSKDSRLITKAAVKSAGGARKSSDRRLGCCLPTGVETVPLYTLDTAEALDHLVQSMKAMWNKAVS